MFRPTGVRRFACLLAASLALCSTAGAKPAAQGWLGSWASSQQSLDAYQTLMPFMLEDSTLRMVVHLSAGGSRIRVRISNAFGSQPMHVGHVGIARALSPLTGEIVPQTSRILTFSGSREVTVPAGAEYWSDPVELAVAPLSDLAISIYFAQGPGVQTGHPGARQLSWIGKGDQTAAVQVVEADPSSQWWQLSGVDVWLPRPGGAVVVLGDSITDGLGVKPGTNTRWTDRLAERLQTAGLRSFGVLNAGIGGNHVLTDGLGPNALARLDRDVLLQSGVRTVIVFEGVNDLGGLAREGPVNASAHAGLVKNLIAAYAQIVARAREHGLRIIGATITPFGGSDYYHPDVPTEADRQAINAWIRAPGHFDSVIDFDQVLRDPAKPDHLKQEFDSGDHLHPSAAGYRALGNAVPLRLLLP